MHNSVLCVLHTYMSSNVRHKTLVKTKSRNEMKIWLQQYAIVHKKALSIARSRAIED